MPATIARTDVKAPEPVPGDPWTLFLRVARSMYPELPLFLFGPPR